MKHGVSMKDCLTVAAMAVGVDVVHALSDHRGKATIVRELYALLCSVCTGASFPEMAMNAGRARYKGHTTFVNAISRARCKVVVRGWFADLFHACLIHLAKHRELSPEAEEALIIHLERDLPVTLRTAFVQRRQLARWFVGPPVNEQAAAALALREHKAAAGRLRAGFGTQQAPTGGEPGRNLEPEKVHRLVAIQGVAA